MVVRRFAASARGKTITIRAVLLAPFAVLGRMVVGFAGVNADDAVGAYRVNFACDRDVATAGRG